MADALEHLAGVVNRAVVSAQLNHRQAKRARFIGALGRHFAYARAYALFVEIGCGNAAD